MTLTFCTLTYPRTRQSMKIITRSRPVWKAGGIYSSQPVGFSSQANASKDTLSACSSQSNSVIKIFTETPLEACSERGNLLLNISNRAYRNCKIGCMSVIESVDSCSSVSYGNLSWTTLDVGFFELCWDDMLTNGTPYQASGLAPKTQETIHNCILAVYHHGFF